jgi:hypothetical protein
LQQDASAAQVGELGLQGLDLGFAHRQLQSTPLAAKFSSTTSPPSSATRSLTRFSSENPQAQLRGTRLISSMRSAVCRHLFAPPP